MTEGNAFNLGALIIGLLLIVMTMGSSFVSRLPLSAAMLYLGAGIAIGPIGLGLVQLDALENRVLLERVTEIAVLISLFTAGMKLELPLRDRRWRIPIQLATVSMVLTVAAVTVLGVYGLGLSLGVCIPSHPKDHTRRRRKFRYQLGPFDVGKPGIGKPAKPIGCLFCKRHPKPHDVGAVLGFGPTRGKARGQECIFGRLRRKILKIALGPWGGLALCQGRISQQDKRQQQPTKRVDKRIHKN